MPLTAYIHLLRNSIIIRFHVSRQLSSDTLMMIIITMVVLVVMMMVMMENKRLQSGQQPSLLHSSRARNRR